MLGDAERALLEHRWQVSAHELASHERILCETHDMAQCAAEALREAEARHAVIAARSIDRAGFPRRALPAPLAHLALLSIIVTEAVLNFGAADMLFAPRVVDWFGTGPRVVHLEALAVTLTLSIVLPVAAHLFGSTCAGGWTQKRAGTWGLMGILVVGAVVLMSHLRVSGFTAERAVNAIETASVLESGGVDFLTSPTGADQPIGGVGGPPEIQAWWFVVLGTLLLAFSALIAFYAHDSLEELTEARRSLDKAQRAAARAKALAAGAEARVWARIQAARARGREELAWYRRGHRQVAEKYPGYYDDKAHAAHDPTSDIEDRWNDRPTRRAGHASANCHRAP
ncbi:MAG: hypothetical protein IPJ56_02605 [Gemmatimonadetes bacterium]|nr:hypothetical protein [Gemmatimonadota bacterium]